MQGKRHGVILAAGEGTRMNSSLPKVCHRCFGEPLVNHVVRGLQRSKCENVTVVVGAGKEKVRSVLPETVKTVEQTRQLGTGDALGSALDDSDIPDDAHVLVSCGDIPGVNPETYTDVFEKLENNENELVLLAASVDNPQGYGRVITDETKAVNRVVEEKDASSAEKEVNLVNTGIMAAEAALFRRLLPELSAENQAGEYYLTDVIELIVNEAGRVELVTVDDNWQVTGINTRRRLIDFEREGYRRRVEKLLDSGVTVHDPDRLKVGPWVEVGTDVEFEGEVTLFGETKIGTGTLIRGNTYIYDSVIGENNYIVRSHIEEAEIGSEVRVGPFCHVRPQTVVKDRVRLGNFVEVKKTRVESDTNISHLSYIGDAAIGSNVNVGAGTITCNYDGYEKHQTIISDGVFVGSNCELVAPVNIGAGAILGAGSTITGDVPARALALSRVKQDIKENWVTEIWRPRKERENDQSE